MSEVVVNEIFFFFFKVKLDYMHASIAPLNP